MKIIYLLSVFVLYSIAGFAQARIEDIETKEIVRAGDIVFVKSTLPFTVDYSNQNNKWIDTPYLQFKDGTPLDEYDYDAYELKANRASFDMAIRATFTKTEFQALANNPPALMTTYYVVSPEGQTIEVAFIIPTDSKVLIDLPPEKFALLEKNLKKYLKWTVNDFGKRMKFLHAWEFTDFPTMKIYYPLFPPAGSTVGSQPANGGTIKRP